MDGGRFFHYCSILVLFSTGSFTLHMTSRQQRRKKILSFFVIAIKKSDHAKKSFYPEITDADFKCAL